MDKIVVFSYKRESLPHSEYQVRKQLEKFLVDDSNSYIITTSTAAIFRVVRAFCHLNYIRLSAEYEGRNLHLDRNMRMNDWDFCPDFTEEDYELEILLHPLKEEL